MNIIPSHFMLAPMEEVKRIKPIVEKVVAYNKQFVPNHELHLRWFISQSPDSDIEFQLGFMKLMPLTEKVLNCRMSILRDESDAIGYVVPIKDGFLEINLTYAEDTSAELKRAEALRDSALKKLNNEKFLKSAPANVVELERKKLADAEATIKRIS